MRASEKIRKRFCFRYNPYRIPYRNPIYLTADNLIKSSKDKSIDDLGLYDFNYVDRNETLMFHRGTWAQTSRQRMDRADLIVYTDRNGHRKILKDRYRNGY